MMKKQLVLVAMILGTSAAPALAQDVSPGATTSTSSGGTIGLGAEAGLLGGPAGAAMVYDMGHLRVDGILGFASASGTTIGLGGRVLWVLHQSSNADFALGGGLGLINRNPDGPADSTTDFHVEGLAQIRVFLSQNVALSTTFGFGIDLNDGRDDAFAFGGQFLSNAGLVYYFR
ncbi:MAG: hypothetical protein SF187_04915 [Deltaproteobacteria bacterium]|nr:hypothetical protein [Deltaproteobacteria bacterium]